MVADPRMMRRVELFALGQAEPVAVFGEDGAMLTRFSASCGYCRAAIEEGGLRCGNCGAPVTAERRVT